MRNACGLLQEQKLGSSGYMKYVVCKNTLRMELTQVSPLSSSHAYAIILAYLLKDQLIKKHVTLPSGIFISPSFEQLLTRRAWSTDADKAQFTTIPKPITKL